VKKVANTVVRAEQSVNCPPEMLAGVRPSLAPGYGIHCRYAVGCDAEY